jgi:hypothetical protein
MCVPHALLDTCGVTDSSPRRRAHTRVHAVGAGDCVTGTNIGESAVPCSNARLILTVLALIRKMY